jgi:RNA polymerase sigma factor (sigma-70 family)
MSRTTFDLEITAAVERRARQLAAAGIPVDREDLVQEGFAIALAEMERYDPEMGSVGAYLRVVLRRALGRVVARWLSPVSLSDGAAADAERYEVVDVDEQPDEGASPEMLVAEAEARARAFAAMAEVLAEMGPRASVMLAEPLDAPANEVGERVGVSAVRVREARWQFRDRVRRRCAL